MMVYRKYFVLGLLLVMASGVLAQTSGFYGGIGGSYGGSFASGYSGSIGNWQAYQPNFNRLYAGDMSNYWPILSRLESDQCNATSDFIIGIPPGGCTPGVVRSDLLEEQNVPVFCQLYAVKVNPLIKVSSIRTISFRGDYPEGVSGIVFHPARAAVRSYDTLLGDPLINNIGYVVIILKRNKVEENMEDWIAGNLTATIRYDAEEAFGTGKAEYYLPKMSDEEWSKDFVGSAFWNGRGYLRVKSVNRDGANIEIWGSERKVIRSFNLKRGETSSLMYFPGYYCRAGLKVRLNSIVAQEDSALLNIDGEEYWVRRGSRFLNNKCRVDRLEITSHNEGSVSVSCTGNERIVLSLGKSGDGGVSDKSYDNDVDKYFNEAGEVVDTLVKEYGAEMKENGEAFAEEALWEQIVLAKKLEKFESAYKLMGTFIEKYSSSKTVEKVRYDRQKMNGTDFRNAYAGVYVNDKFRTISVADFKGFDGKRNVSVRVDGGSPVNWEEGETYDIGDDKITVSRVLPGEVQFRFKSSAKDARSESMTVLEGQGRSFDGVDVFVEKTSVVEVAYVSLLPEVRYTKTEADFSFKIGIEKRGIELTPEKTNRMLVSLNASIDKWENIVDRLGNVVKGLKGACFATSGILMVKNMMSGFGGAALARQKVMENYKVLCDENYETMSRTECYNKQYKDEIAADVAAMTKALNGVNDKMDAAQAGLTESSGIFGAKGVVDQDAYLVALRRKISMESVPIDVGGGKIVEVPVSEIKSVSQLRAVMLHEELKGSGGDAEAISKKELDESLLNVALMREGNKEKVDLEKEFVFDGVRFPVSVLSKGQSAFSDGGLRVSRSRLDGIVSGDLGLGDDDKEVGAQIVHVNSDNYLYVFDAKGAQLGVYEVRKVGAQLKVVKKVSALPPVSGVNVEMAPVGSCSNKWKGEPKVSYYEAGKDKGLPAIVPFDLERGWYAMVPNSGGTFLDDTPQGYTASADVSYFKICNVGTNGLMQTGQGDDLCQSFSVNSVGDVGTFIPCPSLSSTGVKTLYNQGREAIRQASALHDSCSGGTGTIRILNQEIGCGAPMSQIGGFECQDFMSPEDCNLMFNVCDPVICPPSRCDLGGKMPVSDVIQTGVVGGLVMCLPNAAEGIRIPLCLSGIHAGLDSYVSILKSEKECLQRSLETGEHVGICDQITSVYKCEFFWRQLSPVLDQLIPSFVAGLVAPGQRVRGGGEYALVQQSWNTMQKSVDYFKSVYAPGAFRAFNLRSSEEVGSEFCKAFVGTSVPASADAIDSLLEPESPPQFYAQFSERLFSGATVPATSQYKVYFHIYAGNERGVQYRVYLKNPPQSSYYRSNPSVWVDTGYIAKGSAEDQTIDFTAPAGYKELCVVVDAKEECGFKQVSTDLGIQLITKKYTQEQAEKSDIKTEKECMSTSPSALSLANLNPVGSGMEDLAGSDIALSGIIRVCASENPAGGVDERRWEDVGYCGDSKLRCWLDVDSVKDDLKVIEDVSGESVALLDERRGLVENAEMSLEGVRASLNLLSGKIRGLRGEDLKKPEGGEVNKTIWELDLIIGADGVGGAGTNADRAEALGLKATVYRMVALALKEGATVQGEHVANEFEEEEDVVDVSNESGVAEVEILLGDVEKGDTLVNSEGIEYVVRAKGDGGSGEILFSLDRSDAQGLGEQIVGAVSDTLESKGYSLVG
jgi:hypothetical protein